MKINNVLTTLCLTCLLLSGCNDTAARTTAAPGNRPPGGDRGSASPVDPFRERPRHEGGASRVDGLATDDKRPGPNSPVPEPATLLLVGSGLLGLAFLRRRRNENVRK